MAKRQQTTSGVQQVNVTPAARPQDTFSPVRLDPRSISGILDLAPLSASVSAVAGQLAQDYYKDRLEGGQAAVQKFAAANPGLVDQSLGGTEESRAEVRKKLKQAVADGLIPESANPILYELWDEVTAQKQLANVEGAIRLRMEEMTRVTDGNGQRVEPAPYEEVRAQVFEDMGVMSTPGLNSIFGRRVFDAGMAQMDANVRREVMAARAEGITQNTRDGAAQSVRQAVKDLSGNTVWGEEQYQVLSDLDTKYGQGIKDFKKLAVNSMLSEVSALAAVDPDAAQTLLANLSDAKFGPVTLGDDASEFSRGQTYQEAFAQMSLRLEGESERKALRAAQDFDEKLRTDTQQANRLRATRYRELKDQGLSLAEIRETVIQETLDTFGENGPVLADAAEDYFSRWEQVNGKSDPTSVNEVRKLIALGRLDEARMLLTEAIDSGAILDEGLGLMDALDKRETALGALTDDAFRQASGRLGQAYEQGGMAELTGAARRDDAAFRAELDRELTDFTLSAKEDFAQDPKAYRQAVQSKGDELAQRYNQRVLEREQRSTQFQDSFNERLIRYDSSLSEYIKEGRQSGLLTSDEERKLTGLLTQQMARRQDLFESRQFYQVQTSYDSIIRERPEAFIGLNEKLGVPAIDVSTGRITTTPSTEDMVQAAQSYAQRLYDEKLSEIHATADPAQFPRLEAQALQEVKLEMDKIFGEGAPETEKVLLGEAPSLANPGAAISEAQAAFKTDAAPPPTVPPQAWEAAKEATNSGRWEDWEKTRVLGAEAALSAIRSGQVPREQYGQVALNALTPYGVSYKDILTGETEIHGEMPPLFLSQPQSSTWLGIKMRTYGLRNDRVNTGAPVLLTDRAAKVSTYQEKWQAAEALGQAKAWITQWYQDNPGKKAPAQVQLLQRQVTEAEQKLDRLVVPLKDAKVNPYMIRLFESQGEMDRVRKSDDWAKLLSSKNFNAPIEPGSEEETAFIQAQRALLSRARR